MFITNTLDGNIECVKLFLKTETDINKTYDRGNTILIISASNRHKESVKLLLKQGVDINKQNNAGFTALTICARDGQMDVIELLLEYGANINIQTKSGYAAFVHFLSLNTLDIASLKMFMKYGATFTKKAIYFIKEDESDSEIIWKDVISNWDEYRPKWCIQNHKFYPDKVFRKECFVWLCVVKRIKFNKDVGMIVLEKLADLREIDKRDRLKEMLEL